MARKAAKTATTAGQIAVLEGEKSTRLTDATLSEITAAGIATTSGGILLLTLAERIDAVPETSPALASLSKEFAARKIEAFATATAVLDPFDELQAARERRRAN